MHVGSFRGCNSSQLLELHWSLVVQLDRCGKVMVESSDRCVPLLNFWSQFSDSAKCLHRVRSSSDCEPLPKWGLDDSVPLCPCRNCHGSMRKPPHQEVIFQDSLSRPCLTNSGKNLNLPHWPYNNARALPWDVIAHVWNCISVTFV